MYAKNISVRAALSSRLRSVLGFTLCRIALYEPLLDPFKGSVCGLLDRVVKEVWQGGYNGETGKCRSPGAETGVL